MREEAEWSEPIVERDDDRALLRESRAVVAFFTAEPGPESAAVDPDEDGTREAGRGKRGAGRGKREAGSGKRQRVRPDIEVQAILGDAGGEGIDVRIGLVLNAVVTELARITN